MINSVAPFKNVFQSYGSIEPVKILSVVQPLKMFSTVTNRRINASYVYLYYCGRVLLTFSSFCRHHLSKLVDQFYGSISSLFHDEDMPHKENALLVRFNSNKADGRGFMAAAILTSSKFDSTGPMTSRQDGL